MKKLGLFLIAVSLGLLGAILTNNNPFGKHQKLFYIRCVDANGKLTYESRSTEYPVSNLLQGLGTCSYRYR